jgi:glycosyltransferase involved in cell wall biosynthesis
MLRSLIYTGHRMGRVFIGIPTLNRPQLVVHTIESVRNQTFRDFRVVVSDDCSRPEVVAEVARHVAGLADPRFSFHAQAEREGEYGQGRFFLRAAEGAEFMMILHDDDLLHADYCGSAVRSLEAAESAAFFVSDFHVIGADGVKVVKETERYRRLLGRDRATEGLFDVLATHVTLGFAPISGTLFRKRCLDASGFVDDDFFGNYPFESNVFLRLGEIGAKAWYGSSDLMGVRFHPGALRNQHELHNRQIVRSVIRLWERRRFTGKIERMRKVMLSRMYRADALIILREGDYPRARARLFQAIRHNPRSMKAWAFAPALVAAPDLVRRRMRPLTILSDPPKYGPVAEREIAGARPTV